MNGGSVSTHGQKNVFEVTHFDRLRPSARRAGQSAATPRVICKNPLPRSSARTSCWPSRQSRTATTRALCEDHHEGRDLLGAPYERSILPPSQERVRHRPQLYLRDHSAPCFTMSTARCPRRHARPTRAPFAPFFPRRPPLRNRFEPCGALPFQDAFDDAETSAAALPTCRILWRAQHKDAPRPRPAPISDAMTTAPPLPERCRNLQLHGLLWTVGTALPAKTLTLTLPRFLVAKTGMTGQALMSVERC